MNHYSLRLLKWGKYRWLPVVPHEAVAEVSKIWIGKGGMSWCCDVGTINGWSESRFLVSRSSWRNGAMCPSALSDLPVLPDLSDLNLVIYLSIYLLYPSDWWVCRQPFCKTSSKVKLAELKTQFCETSSKNGSCKAESEEILWDFFKKWKL